MSETGKTILLLTLIALVFSWRAHAMPATCSDVAKLTHAERQYWIDRLNISPAQQRAIRTACSRKTKTRVAAE